MAPLDIMLEERTAEALDSPDFEGDAILARLHAAISTLPPKQRWVFQARYFDDRPIRTSPQKQAHLKVR
jgi:DNA-directed RNA polymerase specialized sigma24 family protein